MQSKAASDYFTAVPYTENLYILHNRPNDGNVYTESRILWDKKSEYLYTTYPPISQLSPPWNRYAIVSQPLSENNTNHFQEVRPRSPIRCSPFTGYNGQSIWLSYQILHIPLTQLTLLDTINSNSKLPIQPLSKSIYIP